MVYDDHSDNFTLPQFRAKVRYDPPPPPRPPLVPPDVFVVCSVLLSVCFFRIPMSDLVINQSRHHAKMPPGPLFCLWWCERAKAPIVCPKHCPQSVVSHHCPAIPQSLPPSHFFFPPPPPLLSIFAPLSSTSTPAAESEEQHTGLPRGGRGQRPLRPRAGPRALQGLSRCGPAAALPGGHGPRERQRWRRDCHSTGGGTVRRCICGPRG